MLLMIGAGNDIGPAAAILIGGIVACAAAIAGDSSAD